MCSPYEPLVPWCVSPWDQEQAGAGGGNGNAKNANLQPPSVSWSLHPSGGSEGTAGFALFTLPGCLVLLLPLSSLW